MVMAGWHSLVSNSSQHYMLEARTSIHHKCEGFRLLLQQKCNLLEAVGICQIQACIHAGTCWHFQACPAVRVGRYNLAS